jgi:hypothetical protein
MSETLPKAALEFFRKAGAKGGKASAERGDMAERGRKGANARWAGHQAKRPSRKPA